MVLFGEMFGELISAGLEDALGRAGSEADSPLAAMATSPILTHKMKLATREINEILASGEELTDSDIGRIAAKHELPGDAVRSIREFATAEKLRSVRSVPRELPPLPSRSEVEAADIVSANRSAAKADVPTLTKEQAAARKAMALSGPVSMDEILETMADQNLADEVGSEMSTFQKMAARGRARGQAVKDTGKAIIGAPKEISESVGKVKVKDLGAAAAGIPIPTAKQLVKAGGVGAVLGIGALTLNSMFGTKESKKELPKSSGFDAKKFDKFLDELEKESPADKKRKKALQEFEEASKRLEGLLK